MGSSEPMPGGASCLEATIRMAHCWPGGARVPIGISDDYVELADVFGNWASSLGGIEAVRLAEGDPVAEFAEQSGAVAEMGLAGIAVPEDLDRRGHHSGAAQRRGGADPRATS